MPARKTVVRLSENWRERIGAGGLLARLRQHAYGEIEMTPTQLKAAEILLRKCIPDLAAVQHSGEINHRVSAVELPDDRLAYIASRGSDGVAEAAAGSQEPASVH